MVFCDVVAVTETDGLQTIKRVDRQTDLSIDTYLPDQMIRQNAALLFAKLQYLHHSAKRSRIKRDLSRVW